MSDRNEFPTSSTYVAPFTVTDRENEPLDLTGADIEYVITTTRGGEIVYEVTADDPEITIEPNGVGTLTVTVPAADITFEGLVWEELRIRQLGASAAVSQRTVEFVPVATDP